MALKTKPTQNCGKTNRARMLRNKNGFASEETSLLFRRKPTNPFNLYLTLFATACTSAFAGIMQYRLQPMNLSTNTNNKTS